MFNLVVRKVTARVQKVKSQQGFQQIYGMWNASISGGTREREARSDKQGQNEIVRNFRYTFTTKITFGWKFQNKMKSTKCMFPSKLHVHLRKIFHV